MIEKEVPLWERPTLTIEEYAKYSGIGINKLRSLTQTDENGLFIYIGNKKMIKRKRFDAYLEDSYSV
ncbi:MAG: excisionase [Suipraeoptans sp.]